MNLLAIAFTHLTGKFLRPVTGTRSRAYPDFKQLLGSDQWQRLPRRVRSRFGVKHCDQNETIYAGTMSTVYASHAGRWLAQLCRLLGTPVAPLIGENIPTDVRLYDVPAKAGIAWERLYRFPHHPSVAVRSTKMLDCEGRLIEALGFGLRMKLELSEHDGDLYFVSCGYYFQWGPFKVPLPTWFPPGTVTIIHRDLGAGRFCFILQTDHPWCGRMFYQYGIFNDGVEK